MTQKKEGCYPHGYSESSGKVKVEVIKYFDCQKRQRDDLIVNSVTVKGNRRQP